MKALSQCWYHPSIEVKHRLGSIYYSLFFFSWAESLFNRRLLSILSLRLFVIIIIINLIQDLIEDSDVCSMTYQSLSTRQTECTRVLKLFSKCQIHSSMSVVLLESHQKT